jgi:hypothetical protein
MATPVVVGQAYRLSFTIKSYDKEGDFSDSQNSSTGNPLATIAYLNKNIRDDRVTGNAHLTWEVIEDLSFRISFGIDLLNRREWIFRYEFSCIFYRKKKINNKEVYCPNCSRRNL